MVLAIAATQMLAGGRSLALALPGYGLLAIGAILSIWHPQRSGLTKGTRECLVAGSLFFVYIAVRAIFSPEEYLARKDLFMALGAMTMYLLVALRVTSPTARGLLVASFILLATINCAIEAQQFSVEQNFMPFDFLPRPNYGYRGSGFYGYPNHLAVFLEVTLFLGLAIAFMSRWRPWIKILAGYGCLVCVVGIVLTGSRGGYVGALVGLVAFGLLSLILAVKLAPSRAIVMIVAGGIFFTLVGFGVVRFISSSSGIDARLKEKISSDNMRMRLWQGALEQSKLRPLTGAGSGTYLYYGRQFRHPSVLRDPVHAHNEYLELLAEYGLLGGIFAVQFLLTHIFNGWKRCTTEGSVDADALAIGSNSLALTAGALCAAAACLAHSGLDFTLHMPANMLVMAMVFGLLANPSESPPGAPPPGEEAGGFQFFRWVLPVLGLAILVYALPTWPAEYYAERARTVRDDWHYAASAEDAGRLKDLARKGIAWDSRNPLLYFYLGDAESALAGLAASPAEENELSQAALAAYQKAYDRAPGDLHVVLALAWAYQGLGRFSEAEPLFKRAIELAPNSNHVHYSYAFHLHAQGKLAEAEAEYRKSINLRSGPSAEKGLERLLEQRKSTDSGTTSPAIK